MNTYDQTYFDTRQWILKINVLIVNNFHTKLSMLRIGDTDFFSFSLLKYYACSPQTLPFLLLRLIPSRSM